MFWVWITTAHKAVKASVGGKKAIREQDRIEIERDDNASSKLIIPGACVYPRVNYDSFFVFEKLGASIWYFCLINCVKALFSCQNCYTAGTITCWTNYSINRNLRANNYFVPAFLNMRICIFFLIYTTGFWTIGPNKTRDLKTSTFCLFQRLND